MWKLKHTKKEHWEQFVLVESNCIVGRKDAALLISNDPSVSRKHSVLFVKHFEENLGNPSKKSSLFMRDEGSKYGTYKNGEKIENEVELTDGDVVKFGQFESEFRVHYIPLVVTTSCLDVTSKNRLKNSIYLLGGHLVSEWQPSCTHLVMSEVKVTIKAVCCLVSLRPIVLPQYFEELEEKLKESATFISPDKFIPPIGEALIDRDKVSFDVNPQRKNMFKDKSFFFMDEKQFKKLNLGIVIGGGKASIIKEDNNISEFVINENSCFIEPVRSQAKEEMKNLLREIISALQKKNLRMIPESDIGLSVAYASTEAFCNPGFQVGSACLGSQGIPSQTLSEREVYAPNSEEQSEKIISYKRTSLLNLGNQPKNKKQKTEPPDSLNFTSFRNDDVEEAFEVPLSAEVKKEMDDIFEATMKANYDDPDNEVEELPSTLPLGQNNRSSSSTNHSQKENSPVRELTPPKRLKVELNVSTPNGNEDNIKEQLEPTITRLPKKPKIEQNTSVVNCNGFNSVTVNGDDGGNLPRNLMKIVFADLVVRAARSTTDRPIVNTNVKNFKKFKKVYPKKTQALPKIIGGHDLVPYDKDAAKLPEDWDDDIEVNINHQPVKGAFDWE